MKKKLLLLTALILTCSIVRPGSETLQKKEGDKKGTPKIQSYKSRTKRAKKITRLRMRRLIKGKTTQFLIVPAFKNNGFLHDTLANQHLLTFDTSRETYNVTSWILDNFYAGKGTVPIYFRSADGRADSLIYTFILPGGRFLKRFGKCSGNQPPCCENCMESNSRTFVMDMCTQELCHKAIRPMIFTSGRCLGKNELKIGCNELLSFAIVNNNPLKYEIEIDHNEISFNTDHGDFDAAMTKLGAAPLPSVSTSTDVIKPTEYNEDSASTPNLSVDRLIEATDKMLDSIEVLLTEVRAYVTTKTNESCLDELQLKKETKILMVRYRNAFGTEGPEKEVSNNVGKVDSLNKKKTITEVQKKSFADLQARIKKLVPDSINKLKQLISTLLGISTSYALLPIQVNDDDADVVELTIRRKNLVTKASEEYKYDFRVRGGVKIDFSAGPALSLLHDEKFTTKDVQTTNSNGSVTTTRQIIKEKGDDFSYMFGSVMHVYLRSGGYANLGLHLGAAINTQQRAVLLTGVSIMLGRQQRFCINAGLAFANVKRLADSYEVGQEFTASGEVPTTERFTGGLSFGLSYNLTKPKTVANR